jgi:hypothetical protein
MNKNIAASFLSLILLMAGVSSHADDASGGETGAFDAGIHMLTSGYRDFPGWGAAFNYIASPNWAVGAMLVAMRSHLNEWEGGNLDNAEYYSQFVDQQFIGLEGNATYFFRENGVRRWGPLLRGGVGYAYQRATAHWSRYDRDPAWIVFGSDNRELESGQGETKDWSQFYTRVGAAFQFALGPQWISHGGGHLLEIGANAVIPFGRKSASFQKHTTGEVVTITAPVWEPMVDISYRIVF